MGKTDKLETIVERIRQQAQEFLRTDSKPVVQILSVRDQPCSTIARLKVDDGRTKMNLVVKTYRFPEIETSMEKMLREYETLTLLNDRKDLFSECSVITPLACFRDLQAIVTAEQAGVAFNAILKRGTKWPDDPEFIQRMMHYARRCGMWLRSFQKAGKCLNGRSYSHEDTVADVRSKLGVSIRSGLLSGKEGDRLTKCLDRLTDLNMEDIPLCGMHSDFIPSNILVTEDRVVAMDFADFRTGPVYRDAVTFVHALDNYRWHPLARSQTIRQLQMHFLAGYGEKIKARDVPLVILLEVRQILGELVNLPKTVGRGWLSTVARRSARRVLVNRLLNVVDRADGIDGPYRICGVPWDGVDEASVVC